MVKLLLWKPVVDILYEHTRKEIEKYHIQWYLAIFMMGENNPSATYVRRKVDYAHKVWLETKVFTDEKTIEVDIASCNHDKACIGIIIQLPLPPSLEAKKQYYIDLVAPHKDADCLGTGLLHRSAAYGGELTISPATPSAVMHLLQYYNIHHSINWFQIAVLGESDLIGKPLAKILSHMWGYVHTFNEHSNQKRMRQICKESDIIISATGKLHLVDEEFVRDDCSQIVIDVGRGSIDGKPTWDVNFAKIEHLITAYTPVPWGIGPVTVASLFRNIVVLYKYMIEWKFSTS